MDEKKADTSLDYISDYAPYLQGAALGFVLAALNNVNNTNAESVILLLSIGFSFLMLSLLPNMNDFASFVNALDRKVTHQDNLLKEYRKDRLEDGSITKESEDIEETMYQREEQ